MNTDRKQRRKRWGEWFHHPAVSAPVLRRRVGHEILQALAVGAQIVATRGRAATWNRSYPNRGAYHMAVYRLRKAGLVAYRRASGAPPVLALTELGESSVPPALRHRSPWPKSWDGLWYVLLYDVPEKERAYREALRGFLKRMRMGCLQRSVWITPRDIRPEFEDLKEAAAVDDYAFLLESRTVLGQSPQAVVQCAWNMGRLADIQQKYLKLNEENLARAGSPRTGPQDLATLARLDTLSYLQAMEKDPFLPRPLWPPGYLGEQARDTHRLLARELGRRL